MLDTPLESLFQDNRNPTFEEVATTFSGLPREDLLKCLYESLLTYHEWKYVIDQSNDGIYIGNEAGHGLYVNDAYKAISGLSLEEIRDLPPEELVNQRYIDKSCILLVRETRRATTIESYFYRTGKQCLVTCKPVFDNDGNIALMIGCIRDMTEINSLRAENAKDKSLITKYEDEIASLKKQFLSNDSLVLEDPASLELLRAAQKIAHVDSSVMLTGETGVGKEIIAKYIHNNSSRSGGPFIKLNCSTIAENLFESELFGYERGAFTGAKQEGKLGLFEAADNGTIFLDEIGELPLPMQAKLLRVLQEREITRVGSTKPVKINVRVISATNRDLRQMVAENLFRADLYYRLNVVPIHILPLRERPGDILPLAEHFRVEINQKYAYQKTFSPEALRMIQQYSWPGNVRELRNMVERAIIISEADEIEAHEFESIQTRPAQLSPGGSPLDLSERLRRIEYRYMRQAYRKYRNMKDAAQAVGMKKSTFAGKFKLYQEKYGDSLSELQE